MQIDQLKHPKESFYRTLCLVIGGLLWLPFIFSMVAILALLPIALILWISEKFFQASLFGNAVHVGNNQYAEIHKMTQQMAQQMKLEKTPEVFVINSQGLTNALAVKFLSKKYVILYSDLVDLLWEDGGNQDKLRTVIAHELAHHAAGHVNFWTNLIMGPAHFIPFLGAAYSRACELSADRISAAVVNNQSACTAALITLASGSRALVPQTNQDTFIEQEHRVPGLFGFYQEILSSHPRMTRRILAIREFYHQSDYAVNEPVAEAVS